MDWDDQLCMENALRHLRRIHRNGNSTRRRSRIRKEKRWTQQSARGNEKCNALAELRRAEQIITSATEERSDAYQVNLPMN